MPRLGARLAAAVASLIFGCTPVLPASPQAGSGPAGAYLPEFDSGAIVTPGASSPG